MQHIDRGSTKQVMAARNKWWQHETSDGSRKTVWSLI